MTMYNVELVLPCHACGSTDGLFTDLGAPVATRTGADRYMVSCGACGHVVAIGNDILSVFNTFLIGNTNKSKKTASGNAHNHLPPLPPLPPLPNQKPHKSPSTSSISQSFGKPTPNKDNPIHLSFRMPKSVSPVKEWRMKEAYEANKKSKKCVVCGKPLSMHVSVSVLYCKCIESLPV